MTELQLEKNLTDLFVRTMASGSDITGVMIRAAGYFIISTTLGKKVPIVDVVN